MVEQPSDEAVNDAGQRGGGAADPDAEAQRLLGLGPKLKEFLQGFDVSEGQGPGDLPPRFGRYRVLRLIGEGGMGSVYEAQQDNPRRHVAVKVVKLGMDTKQVLARFEAEREALALMDHPNIAGVLDAGVSDAGRPFFVMELVRGVPVTEYSDTNGLPVRERLGLFIAVCRAVQHAHQKAIIHRDLKPSNVLVTMVDGKPVPKVIDFGIAKATGGQRLTERTLFTEYRELVGTPEYMSPEQAEMSGIDIDTRSDVYSLGVLLYELLTGTTPFDRTQLRGSDSDEVRRLIREVEPPRPSTRLSRLPAEAEADKTVAKIRRTDPATLLRAVRGELDWIVMKCLEKDRTRRYETANELAADLERHLRNEPVHAGPPSTTYRLRKFARRNRGPLAAAGAMVVLLVAGSTGTTVGMLRAKAAQGRSAQAEARAVAGQQMAEDLLKKVSEAQAEARREADQVGALNEFLLEMFRAARPDAEGGGADVKVADLLDRAAANLPEKFHGQPEAEIRGRITLGDTYGHLGLQNPAIENLSIAYELARKHFGEEAKVTLDAGWRLAHWMIQGQGSRPWSEAEQLARHLHKIAARTLGEADKNTYLAAKALGWALFQQKKHKEAEDVYRRLLQVQREAPSSAGITPQTGLHGLARCLHAQGKLEEAEATEREAMRISAVLGERSPRELAVQRRALALILTARGKLNEAADVCLQGLQAEPQLGHANPIIENISQNYVDVLVRQGKVDTAVEFARQRLDRAASATPRDERLVAGRTARLMGLLRLAGRHDDAAQLQASYTSALQSLVEQPADTHAALARRALARADLGQFKEAADDYARCIELDPSQYSPWFFRGCLLAYLADREAYESHCRRMLQRFGQTTERTVADRTAKTYLLVPRSLEECQRVMPLVDRALEGERVAHSRWFQMLKGLAEYRAGEFDNATQSLHKARDDPPPEPAAVATIELLLAMSHHRLGRSDEARAALDRGRHVIDTSLPSPSTGDIGVGGGIADRLICHVILREAQALIPAEAATTRDVK